MKPTIIPGLMTSGSLLARLLPGLAQKNVEQTRRKEAQPRVRATPRVKKGQPFGKIIFMKHIPVFVDRGRRLVKRHRVRMLHATKGWRERWA
jgi:hypothetical protein